MSMKPSVDACFHIYIFFKSVTVVCNKLKQQWILASTTCKYLLLFHFKAVFFFFLSDFPMYMIEIYPSQPNRYIVGIIEMYLW